jgi:hypothetical protein
VGNPAENGSGFILRLVKVAIDVTGNPVRCFAVDIGELKRNFVNGSIFVLPIDAKGEKKAE